MSNWAPNRSDLDSFRKALLSLPIQRMSRWKLRRMGKSKRWALELGELSTLTFDGHQEAFAYLWKLLS
jgi:hypothetical protein